MGAQRHLPEEKRGASIEELAKRMVTIDNSDEDLAKMLANNWQNILWAVILLGVGIVVFREFQATKAKKAEEISQRFSEVQQDFQKLLSGKPEDKASPALAQNLHLLTTSYSDESYGRLAAVYEAALLRSEKKYDEARQSLAKFPVGGLFGTVAAKTLNEVEKNDLVLELAALLVVRLGLDDGKTGVAEIRKQLTGLAYGSRFATGEALLSLFRLSHTPEEKAEARQVAKNVFSARASLKGALLQQLSREDIQAEEGGESGAETITSSVSIPSQELTTVEEDATGDQAGAEAEDVPVSGTPGGKEAPSDHVSN